MEFFYNNCAEKCRGLVASPYCKTGSGKSTIIKINMIDLVKVNKQKEKKS